MSNERTEEQWHAQQLVTDIEKVAEQLRTLAERVEVYKNHVAKIGTGPGWDSYGQVAYDVMHDLVWGLPNLNADRVIRRATDADVARAKGI